MKLATAVFPRVCTTTVERPNVDLYREVSRRAATVAGNSDLFWNFGRTYRRIKWARELEQAKLAQEHLETRLEANP
jgi:hypothetical protein